MHGQSHLLIDVAVILGAAFPILFLSRRLRLPEVISYLVTGIIIGPHALAWVKETAAVEAIAELGVALILFFIGLHVPLDRLRAMGRMTFLSGSMQIAFTLVLTLMIAVPSGLEPKRALFMDA